MAGEHAPRQQGRLCDSPATIEFVPGDQTATQLPFIEGSGAMRFGKHSEQKTVGGAHTVPVMTGEQAAERSRDSVVPVLLPRPEGIKAANRVVGRRTGTTLSRDRSAACSDRKSTRLNSSHLVIS